jgi:hypothetical protein
VKLIAVLIAALSVASPQALQRSALDWPAKVAFGDLSFDFEKGVVTAGDATSQLEDCSTAEFSCARSLISNVVLPRKCPVDIKVGDRWSGGGVTMAVVGEVDEPMGHHYVFNGPLYLVQAEGNDRFAVLYKRGQGGIALFYSADGPLDLSWARPAGPGDFDPVYRVEKIRRTYKRTTGDHFGQCF